MVPFQQQGESPDSRVPWLGPPRHWKPPDNEPKGASVTGESTVRSRGSPNHKMTDGAVHMCLPSLPNPIRSRNGTDHYTTSDGTKEQ
mmetsp:Transcript_22283/g.51402  ORF Transcript_22283/g.51402 Transcript_22283/m.51402 type:complete len:87 (-) Transcript_22283:161-421(-)